MVDKFHNKVELVHIFHQNESYQVYNLPLQVVGRCFLRVTVVVNFNKNLNSIKNIIDLLKYPSRQEVIVKLYEDLKTKPKKKKFI
jgi:hypothetical protein